MYDFLKYVLRELKNGLLLAALAGITALAVLGIAAVVYKKKYGSSRKFPWGKALLWLIFIGYMAVVAYATVFRSSGGYREWNLHLFRAWREAWNNFSFKNWANVLLNVAMFVPLGMLLPPMGQKFRKWFLTIPVGFVVSLGVELLQLAMGRGICDVDDLFANTLGAAVGYFLIMAVLWAFGQKGKRLKMSLLYGGMLLGCIGAIGSAFIVYEIKEYGNLPMAAAYTNRTVNVTWTLDCGLPEAADTLPVYRTQTRSTADCDAFAAEMAAIAGGKVDYTAYYQESAYYMFTSRNSSGTLMVNYHDGSFSYHLSSRDGKGLENADRETVALALEKYPVAVPEYGEFASEGDGWYTFSVERHIDGAVMVDGVLRCRLAENGTLWRLENHLLYYTYHDAVPVLSPQGAYRELCAGKFYDGGYFEYKAPEIVHVFSCRLGYEIDTKGFYQRVYYFDVTDADGNYQDCIMIPAME